MKTWLVRLSIAAIAVLPTLFDTAAAQSAVPGFVFVQDSSGQLWFTARDTTTRLAVPIYPATDEQIAAIPASGLWVIPKPDGSGTSAGARPEWAVGSGPPSSAPVEAAPVAEQSVKMSGERGENTKPFDLRGGNYTVIWKTELRRDAPSCFSGATLYRVEGKRHIESLFSVLLDRDKGERSASGQTQVYGVTAGQHFLDVNTTTCSWSVEIRPQ